MIDKDKNRKINLLLNKLLSIQTNKVFLSITDDIISIREINDFVPIEFDSLFELAEKIVNYYEINNKDLELKNITLL